MSIKSLMLATTTALMCVFSSQVSLECVEPVEALPAELAVEPLLLLPEVDSRKVVERHLGVLKLVHYLVHDRLFQM